MTVDEWLTYFWASMLGVQGQLGSAAVGFYQGPGSSIGSIRAQKDSVSGLMETEIVVYVYSWIYMAAYWARIIPFLA